MTKEQKALSGLRRYVYARTKSDYWKKGRDGKSGAVEDFEFYLGHQWNQDEVDALAADNRPALTVNGIAPKINHLLGIQRQSRTDLAMLPREDGDGGVAEILTKLTKHISIRNELEYVDSDVFRDGAIGGRGWWVAGVSYTRDPITGAISLKQGDPFSIHPDPDSKEYDLSDAEYICYEKWVAYERLKKLFPTQMRSLSSDVTTGDDDEDKEERMGVPIENLRVDVSGVEGISIDEFVDKESRRLKVIETYYREPKSIFYVASTEDGTLIPANDRQEADESVAQLSERDQSAQVIETQSYTLRVSWQIGKTILFDKPSPFRTKPGTEPRYPFIPYFPMKVGDQTPGLVAQVKDSQREVNKRRSQFMHMVNVSANNLIIAEGNLPPEAERDIISNMSKPNALIKVPAGAKVRRESPPQISPSMMVLEEKSQRDLNENLGINPDMAGFQDQTLSGRAMDRRVRQGQTNITYVFDNFRRSKANLGKFILDFIQGHYRQEKVERILLDNGDTQMTPLNQIDPNDVNKVLNDVRIGTYDVRASDVPASETSMEAVFFTLADLAQKTNAVPIDMLIELHPGIPETKKKQLIQRILEQQQQMQQAEALGGGTPRNPQSSNASNTTEASQNSIAQRK